MRSHFAKSLLLLCLLPLGSCGGGGGGGISGTKEPTVTVDIIESTVTVVVTRTYQFHYNVSDPSYACIWSVNGTVGGNSSVGTITNAGLYTAPSTTPTPSQVTVKAAASQDASVFDTATINISPQIAISPATVSVNINQTQQFTSTVTIDSWQVNDLMWGDDNVGRITKEGLYTAPAQVPTPATVTIKGFSSLLNDTATATVTIVNPKSLNVLPKSVTVPAGATQQFTSDKDVAWSLTGSPGATTSLGTITDTGLYTAPLSPPLNGTVLIVATLKSDTSLKETVTASIVFSNASLQGHYAFRYRNAESADMTFAAGAFVADGAGMISSGSIYLNMLNGEFNNNIPFTGTYAVAADGKATVSLSVQGDNVSMRFILISNSSARMMGFAEDDTGVGSLDQQDPSAFTTGPSGTYVFTWDGLQQLCSYIPLQTGRKPLSAIGQFTATNASAPNGNLTITNGNYELNLNGTWISVQGSNTFTGEYTFDPSTASGTITFYSGTVVYPGPVSVFRYYMLSADAAVLVSYNSSSLSNCGWGLNGIMVRTTGGPFSNASLIGPMAMLSYGYLAVPSPQSPPYTPPGPVFAAGAVTADGNGSFTTGLADNNVDGAVNQAMPLSGTYSISSNGHGTLTATAGGSNNHQVFYMLGPDSAYTIGIDNWGPAFTQFLPQAGSGYTLGTLGGHFAFSMRGTLSSEGIDAVGQIVLNMNGGLTGTADFNRAGVLSPDLPLTGTYTLDSTGRGTLTIAPQGMPELNMTMYLQSSRLVLLMGTSTKSLGYLQKQY